VPNNPSIKQSEASRQNLRGKEGPKTTAGKQSSAANGAKNQGTKTAKARARIIAARHGLNEDSFYARAGCLQCQKHCVWPSFSSTTPFKNLPLGCLQEVLMSRPDQCFFYLEGLCLADFREGYTTANSRAMCVVEPGFLKTFNYGSGEMNEEALNVSELRFRKQIISFVNEAQMYMSRLRKEGLQKVEIHPRMLKVLRKLRDALNHCAPCRYTPWKDYNDWDECLQWIAEGKFEG
jgi:hypothetical protein